MPCDQKTQTGYEIIWNMEKAQATLDDKIHEPTLHKPSPLQPACWMAMGRVWVGYAHSQPN